MDILATHYTPSLSYIQSSYSLPALLGSLVALDRNELLPFVQLLRIKSMSL
jgi:hypothetical protein